MSAESPRVAVNEVALPLAAANRNVLCPNKHTEIVPVCTVSIILQQHRGGRGGTGGASVARCEDPVQVPMGTGAPGDPVDERK